MASAGTLGRHNIKRPNVGSKVGNPSLRRKMRKGIGNQKFNTYKAGQAEVEAQRRRGAALQVDFMRRVIDPPFDLPPRLDDNDPVDQDLCRRAYTSMQYTLHSLAEYFNTSKKEIRDIIKA